MRILPIFVLGLVGLAPARVIAQETPASAAPQHVAVEATTVVVDEATVRRLGVDGVVLSSPVSDVGASGGRGTPALRVGTRVGGLEVAAWLDLVRRERAVRSESTQRILVLSGSEAEISGERTLMGAYGQTVSAGPRLWVEPVALEDGRVRLSLWTATGEVRPDRFGGLERTVPVEASTEVVVSSGTSVLVASSETSQERTGRGLLERSGTRAATRSWIVVTPRVVDDPAGAFPLPGSIPGQHP